MLVVTFCRRSQSTVKEFRMDAHNNIVCGFKVSDTFKELPVKQGGITVQTIVRSFVLAAIERYAKR